MPLPPHTPCVPQLYHVGLPPGRFSHVLMDEAGHAEEPLALAGLAGLAGPRTRVVLAGGWWGAGRGGGNSHYAWWRAAIRKGRTSHRSNRR